MEIKIQMISSGSHALSCFRQNPKAIDDEIFQEITDYISSQRIKDENTKIAMIASATHAINIARKNPHLTDKEVVKILIESIPSLLDDLKSE